MAELKDVTAGQALRFSAGDINACFAAARAHRARQLNTLAEASAFDQAGVVRVKNASGADRGTLEVLAIDVPLILPADNLARWRSEVTFSGITPGTTHAGRYVVLQEPIANGKIGRAMVIGVTPALLDVTAESDRFAEVVSTVATSLKTGTTGSARILWKESGTGSKRGVVMLTGEQGAIYTHTTTANPTAGDDAADGYVVGTIWINTTTDAAFIATDVTAAAAVWVPIGTSVHTAAADPTVNDDSSDGYALGTIWVNTSTDAFFIATDVTVGAAAWSAGGGGGGLMPTEDGTVFASDGAGTAGEWVRDLDLGRNATGKAGVLRVRSPDASGDAVVIDGALVTASGKKLTVREIDICDGTTPKKMLVVGSAPY